MVEMQGCEGFGGACRQTRQLLSREGDDVKWQRTGARDATQLWMIRLLIIPIPVMGRGMGKCGWGARVPVCEVEIW